MKFNYYEAPKHLFGSDDLAKISENSIFLAGSITNAWNWQAVAKDALIENFHVFNPRRDNFDVSDKNQEKIQIEWEWMHLEFCRNIFFYFSNETLAPITLLEYGTFLGQSRFLNKAITVAIHPEYQRKNDVIIQTELRAPQLSNRIFFDLTEGLEFAKK